MTTASVSMTAASELLAAHPVIDGHNDFPYAMRLLVDYDLDAVDITGSVAGTQTDLPRLRAGGVGGQFWSVFVPSSWAGEKAVTATLEQIDFVHRMVARYPDRFALATSAAAVERATANGQIASLLGAEGGHSIDNSLAVLRTLHALGVRYMTLTHNDNVPWADSATDSPVLGGLNDFGRAVVAEMNRLAMMVDLSHVAVATMADALDASTAPVLFSHSSARGVVDHVRNVPDDVLARLQTNGGVCMVTFVPSFVSADCKDWDDAVLARMDAEGLDRRDWEQHMAVAARLAATSPAPVATVADVADHVDHVRAVAGIEHVGLGGDFDGCDPMPAGLADVSCYPNLIGELIGRGWSSGDLAALTRGNILRVMRDVEAVAAGQ
jgi:membrane dipeptidase